MTLVLPFGCDQISSNSLFSGGSANNQTANMPCVFENDTFDRDLESALMRDWASDITDYDIPAADSSLKAPSVSNDLKRKSTDELDHAPTKKLRAENDSTVPPVQPEIVSPSSSDHNSSSISSSSVSSSPFSCSSLESSSASTSCSSSSSSSSSSEGGQDDEMHVDDEDYLPRRRGPQMWNSRQKWKDERKKVLKMSINKLADIEDPELCLLRSVLINNTIKKLHLDIRNERQAKLRHRQQRIDFFAERFPPFSSTPMDECFSIDFSNSGNTGSDYNNQPKPNGTSSATSKPTDFHDDSSCDEMFGINEDFLRVPIPDRRVSSPIPTGQQQSSARNDSKISDVNEPVDSSSSNSSNCCRSNSPLPCDSGSPFRTTQNNSQTVSTATTTPAFPHSTSPPHNNNNRRATGSVVSPLPSGGTQCAMQYRTNRDVGPNDSSFTHRVPILDSVVYHSLLASLESS